MQSPEYLWKLNSKRDKTGEKITYASNYISSSSG